MPRVAKSKNSKQSSRKEFIKNGPETSVSNIPDAAGGDAALTEVSCEERHRLIAEAAYFRAERRSFAPGHELEDWLSAEAEIEIKPL